MSLLAFVVVAVVFAGLALAPARARASSTAVGIIGLVATLVAAHPDPAGQVVVVEGGGLATTAYLRLFLILGSLVGLGLAVAGLAGGSRRDAPAVTLGDPRDRRPDPRPGRPARRGPRRDGRRRCSACSSRSCRRGGRAGATVGIRESCAAMVVAGALAIAATAWFGRDLSQLAAQPVVFGLAYLAFALAVAIRFGAIPFHLWAARLTDAVPEAALPLLTALAPAALAVVALAWTDASIAPLLGRPRRGRG